MFVRFGELLGTPRYQQKKGVSGRAGSYAMSFAMWSSGLRQPLIGIMLASQPSKDSFQVVCAAENGQLTHITFQEAPHDASVVYAHLQTNGDKGLYPEFNVKKPPPWISPHLQELLKDARELWEQWRIWHAFDAFP